MTDSHKPRLCILTTVSISIKSFCLDQIRALQQAGFDVTVICAPDPDLPELLPQGVEYLTVEFSRVISPFKDMKAILSLLAIFRRKKFDIVQYSTPKASLLAAIAAWLARIPNRLYLLWGLYYVGVQDKGRVVLKSFEKIICRLSTEILPISIEMVDFSKSQGLVGKTKCSVILNGSACGVDLNLYSPGRWAASRDEVRKQWGIPDDAIVIGTVARLTGDKGIMNWSGHLMSSVAGIRIWYCCWWEPRSKRIVLMTRPCRRSNRIRESKRQAGRPIPPLFMQPWIFSVCRPIGKDLAK